MPSSVDHHRQTNYGCPHVVHSQSRAPNLTRQWQVTNPPASVSSCVYEDTNCTQITDLLEGLKDVKARKPTKGLG